MSYHGVNIDQYCRSPQDYPKLPVETQNWYNAICAQRKAIEKNDKNLKEFAKKFGITLAELPLNMIMAFTNPECLKMISMFVGVDLSIRLFGNAILRALTKLTGQEIWEAAVEMAEARGATFVTSTIMTNALAEAAEESAMAARLATVSKAVQRGFSTAMIVLIIVQFLGQVLDAWDPEGYGMEMNAKSMGKINELFDQSFMTNMLSSITVTKDSFGRDISLAHWPVEYYADSLLGSQKADYYQKKQWEYIAEYYCSIKVNSDGYAVCWPKGGSLMTPNDFDKIADAYSMMLADHNTIVAKWMRKWWILILLLLIIIVIFILIIK